MLVESMQADNFKSVVCLFVGWFVFLEVLQSQDAE